MKYALVVVVLLFGANILCAQTPVISYLQVDEAQSHLWIIGSFGNTPGTISIEDTTLGIVSWSDTMIVCNLPDSGHGAGGLVKVATSSGISNKRVLSIFYIYITNAIYIASHSGYQIIGDIFWAVNWRFDMKSSSRFNNGVQFEASKTSLGQIFSYPPEGWADSSDIHDSSFSTYGYIDISNSTIQIRKAIITASGNFAPHTIQYFPHQISFDSAGKIYGYRDASSNIPPHDDSVWGKILFPPSPKDAVHSSDNSLSNNITVRTLYNNDNTVLLINASEPQGLVTASFYSVNGALLRRENIVMNSAGEYRFDVNGLGRGVGMLVLNTSKGIFTKKVMIGF